MKTIDFPTHPTLNSDGQFNKLRLEGPAHARRWSLYNTTLNQSKTLEGPSLVEALRAVVEPLMA